MELSLGALYSEQAVKSGIDHHKADLIFASVPYKIMHSFHIPVYEEMKKRDADLYSRLEQRGFRLDFGDDGSGLFMKYLRRGSGYYIDVGAAELVASGKVKLKSGDVYQVAEVVRNLAARNRDASLSAAERTMYERARVNLVSEISPALKVSAEDAEAYLDAALAKGVLKPAKEVAKKK